MLETVQSIHGETAVPLAAQSNAEFPDIYVITRLFGALRTTFYPSRGRFVNGCCGTIQNHNWEVAAIATQPV